MKRRIVLLGPPASGKGTQAELMRASYQLSVTSPGAILREELKMGSALGVEAEKYTGQGQLAPAELVNSVMEKWLDRHHDSFVFDGYPRSIEQATVLDRMLGERQAPLDVVISLEVDLETIRDRVARRLMCSACGRIFSVDLHVASNEVPCPACGGSLSRRRDDTPETLELRMLEYETKTAPLIDYYLSRGLLRGVDARFTPEIVFHSIGEILSAA